MSMVDTFLGDKLDMLKAFAQSGVKQSPTQVQPSTAPQSAAPAAPVSSTPPTAQEYTAMMLEQYKASTQKALDAAPDENAKKMIEDYIAKRGPAIEMQIKEFVLKSPAEQAVVLNSPQLIAQNKQELVTGLSTDITQFATATLTKQSEDAQAAANNKKNARENNGVATAGSVMSWGSMGLAVAGLGVAAGAALSATGVGATIGVPLIGASVSLGALGTGCAVGAATLGVGSGLCKVANNTGPDGDGFQQGMGWLEVALNASVVGGMAAKSVSAFAKSAEVVEKARGPISGAVSWAISGVKSLFSSGGTAVAETSVAATEGIVAATNATTTAVNTATTGINAASNTTNMSQLLASGYNFGDDAVKAGSALTGTTASATTEAVSASVKTVSVAHGQALQAVKLASKTEAISSVGGISAFDPQDVNRVYAALTEFIATGSKEGLKKLPASTADLVEASLKAYSRSDALVGTGTMAVRSVKLAAINAPVDDLLSSGEATSQPMEVRPTQTPAQVKNAGTISFSGSKL